MKPKDLVEVSKELNALLFDPKKKDEGWIDITDSNVKKMTKGIKEAAAIIEPDDKLSEESRVTMREIDWSLEDYEEADATQVQATLQKMGVWVNEDDAVEVGGEVIEKPKKKAATKKKEPEVEKKEPKTKKRGGTDCVIFLTPLIKTKKYTQKELVDLGKKEFTELSPSTIYTLLTDGRNPKYNKFEKLLVKNDKGVINFAK